MFITFGNTTIQLKSTSEPIINYWRSLFGCWLKESGQPTLTLTLEWADNFENLQPDSQPFFVDDRPGGGVLEAHAKEENTLLYFYDGGSLVIPNQRTQPITGWVTEKVITTGRLEDMTLVAIAPYLRTQNQFILHASGATKNGQAILFVGGSGSGKTTTCLNLIAHGWHLLSNDVILLEKRGDGVFAHPMPDKITIRPKTLTLLPQLKNFLDHAQQGANAEELYISAEKFTNGHWSAPSRVSTICFPQVGDGPTSLLKKQLSTISFAKLLEESVDRWDGSTLAAHTAMMSALSQQANTYQLTLGSDLPALAAQLSRLQAPTPQ